MRWGAVVAALVVGLVPTVVASAPASAVPQVPVRVGSVVGALVPGPACTGSSLCNSANLPILMELGSGTRAAVPAAQAARGGYYATYGGSGLSGEAVGGAAGLALGSSIWGALKWWGDDEQLPGPLPFAPAVTGKSFFLVRGAGTATMDWGYTLTGSEGHWTSISLPYSVTRVVGASTNITATLLYKCGTNPDWQIASGVAASYTGPKTGTLGGACGSGFQALKLANTGGASTGAVLAEQIIPVTAEPDPLRWAVRTIDCVNGSGDHITITSESAKSVSAQEGWQVPGGQCPAGYVAVSDSTVLHTQGYPEVPIQTVTVPQTLLTDMGGTDGHCIGSAGVGDCKVEIRHLRADGRTDDEPVPRDWAKRADNYACMYGGRVIAREFCLPYSPEVAPKSDTELVPAPVENPQALGTPVADPVMNPVPPPTPAPVPPWQPETEADTQAFECPGIDMSIKAFLTGKVVFQAVSCAITWTFVPSPTAVQASLDAVRQAWSQSGPMTTVSSARAAVEGITDGGAGGGTGCAEFEMPVHGQRPVADLCGMGMQGASNAVRNVSGIVIGIAAVLAAIALVLGAFGMRTPWGGGGDDE